MRFCFNCRRSDDDSIHSEHLNLELIHYNGNEVKFYTKRKFSSFSEKDDISGESFCKQCYCYLSADEKSDEICWENIWPSCLWLFLSNSSQRDAMKRWKFIPEEWRFWWRNYFSKSKGIDILLEECSFFVDRTVDWKRFDVMLKELKLANISKTCTELLLPNVLCPWSCCVYIHDCGSIPFDCIMHRFNYGEKIKFFHKLSFMNHFRSCKNNFLEKNDSYLLCNPKWHVKKTVCILPGKGAVLLCCKDHSGGSLKRYLFSPDAIQHNLPSKRGEQFAHVVLQPRLVKAMKTKAYSNIYQVVQMNTCYSGIDTCDANESHCLNFYHIYQSKKNVCV